MKEGFLGLNLSVAWIALSLPLDMIENIFVTNFSLTSCFVGKSSEGDMFVSSSSSLLFLPDDLPIYSSCKLDIESQWQSYQI